MFRIAFRNLFYDRVRLAVTLTGIVFSLILIAVQFGLFLGFLETSTNVITHNDADLYISAPKIPHINGGSPIPEIRRYKALAIPGVAEVAKYAVFFVIWKLPSGAQESIQIVGYEPNSGLGRPWNLVAGDLNQLKNDDTVIIDQLYLEKLGVKGIGEPAMVPTIPAVMNAIYDAVGVRVFDLPATPEKILLAMREKARREAAMAMQAAE